MLKEIIESNLGSGRFWLTIISGIVFAYATYTKLLSGEAVSAIITMVFMSYFQKDRVDNGVSK